ncbi:hypothetical protein Tco_0766718 [Tanacetum coccineum]
MKTLPRREAKMKSTLWRCGDPNHFISDCPKHYSDQKAFVRGSSSDKKKISRRMRFVSWHMNPTSLKIINKIKLLKTKAELLEKQILELKDESKSLEKDKGLDVGYKSFLDLRTENDTFRYKLARFENSTKCLNEVLGNQKLPNDKRVLGFTKCVASTSEVKQINFAKKDVKSTSDRTDLSDPENALIIHVLGGVIIYIIIISHELLILNSMKYVQIHLQIVQA